MAFVDLHLHSNQSDGSDTPERVVERALLVGATAISLTDHDTVSGVATARDSAQRGGLDFLTGTEISTYYKGREIHVLGLGIDIAHEGLLSALDSLCEQRRNRGVTILAQLAARDMPLTGQLLEVEGGALGRMHIACAMTDAGYVKKPQEAFDRYLNAGKPAYVPKRNLPIEEAIDHIHAAGGLAFVAHPGLGKNVRKLLPELLTLPFDGIEAYHVSHNPGRVEEFRTLAQARGLLISGGSDCHGTVKGKALLGSVQTPRAVYDAIQEALARR